MKKWMILGLIALLAVTGALLGYNAWYKNTHIFVGKAAYERN